MEVHFQCTIQICRYQCPDQCDSGNSQPTYGSASSTVTSSGDSYGSPKAPAVSSGDSYGSPKAPAVQQDSYGSPKAPAQSSYGAPQAAPQNSYSAPQSSYSSPHGKRRRRRSPLTVVEDAIEGEEDEIVEDLIENEEEHEDIDDAGFEESIEVK